MGSVEHTSAGGGGPGSGPIAPARPFVGRTAEMARIGQILDQVLAGPGQFLLLMGEPGIGKTRLCDELTALGGGRGVPVMWGRSWEAGGAPAYWPWLDVLQGLALRLDPAALAAALGDGAPLVVELVPEIRDRLPALAAAAPPPADEARFRLWRTVVALVRRVAEPSGLTLVFDDLHSADRSSLLLLYALARQLRSTRVLLVATCRDVEARLDPETSALVSKLAREGVQLNLGRFDRRTSSDLLRGRRSDLAADIETRIFESTQGNPLFLEELLRLLDEEDGPAAIRAGVVPAGVRDVIRGRLDRVPGEARDLLNAAAVAGDEVIPALLARTLDRDGAWIAARIADATRAGVLVDRGGRPRFSHALMREVLYRELAADQRRGLHAAVGRALENGGGAGAPGAPPLMELAHHAIEGPASDAPRAVGFAVRAARRAIETVAAEEAIAVLDRAARVVDAAGNPPALRAPLVLALAEARIRSGDVETGKALCCEAAALARGLGDAALLAGAALTYGRVLTFAVVDPVMVRLLEDALEAQPPGDSASRAQLMARLAGALQPAVHAEEPVRIARQAIAMARRLGDRRGLLQTIHDALSAMMDVVDPRERLLLNREVETLAVQEGDRERLLRTHARLAVDHLSLGQFAEADACIDAFEALATELRASWILWRAPLFRAVRAATHGRFDEASTLEHQARALSLKTQDPQAERALIFHREGLLRVAERHDEMRLLDARARRERAQFHNGFAWQCVGSAFTYTRLEDEEQVRAHLGAIPEDLRPPIDNLFALFFIAEAAAFVGSTALAEKTYQVLLPHEQQHVMLGMTHVQWEGPVTRLLGLLAAALGRWDAAIGHFEDALAELGRLDARPHLARARYEFGRALLQRAATHAPTRTADVARAHELLRAARDGAEELGLAALAALAESRLRAAEAGAPSRRPPQPEAGDANAAVPAPGSEPVANVLNLALELEGEYWTLSPGTPDTPVRLKDSLGLQYIARLMAEPGREIHVLDLVGAGQRSGEASGGEPSIDLGDAGEHLDDEARADYRRRLDDLRDTLAEAESFGDTNRAARARAEIDFLASELTRAVGIGGRSRRAGSAAERARSAVQRRIKNALGRIDEVAPVAGAALARRLKTGNFCVYRLPQ